MWRFGERSRSKAVAGMYSHGVVCVYLFSSNKAIQSCRFWITPAMYCHTDLFLYNQPMEDGPQPPLLCCLCDFLGDICAVLHHWLSLIWAVSVICICQRPVAWMSAVGFNRLQYACQIVTEEGFTLPPLQCKLAAPKSETTQDLIENPYLNYNEVPSPFRPTTSFLFHVHASHPSMWQLGGKKEKTKQNKRIFPYGALLSCLKTEINIFSNIRPIQSNL